MPRIPVEIKIEADALEGMARKHVDRLMDELGYRCDMRAVIIVEFWAMMAGALPFGWDISSCGHQAWGPGMSGTKSRELEYGLGEIVAREAWAAEYTARPRLER